MIYEYRCIQGHKHSVTCSVADYKPEQICPECSLTAKRVFNAPRIAIMAGEFNPGLGRYVGNRQDKIDALNRRFDKDGSRMVEVGNERPNPKPKRHSYELTRDEWQKVDKILEGVE